MGRKTQWLSLQIVEYEAICPYFQHERGLSDSAQLFSWQTLFSEGSLVRRCLPNKIIIYYFKLFSHSVFITQIYMAMQLIQ